MFPVADRLHELGAAFRLVMIVIYDNSSRSVHSQPGGEGAELASIFDGDHVGGSERLP